MPLQLQYRVGHNVGALWKMRSTQKGIESVCLWTNHIYTVSGNNLGFYRYITDTIAKWRESPFKQKTIFRCNGPRLSTLNARHLMLNSTFRCCTGLRHSIYMHRC